MMKRTINIFLAMILTLAGAQNVKAQESLENMVDDAFNKIKMAPDFSCPCSIEKDYGTESKTHAELKGTIVINIAQLQGLVDQVEPAFANSVVRMTVAHEYAHEFLFSHYVGVWPSTLVQECQADVISGILVAIADFYDATANPAITHITPENDGMVSGKLGDYWGNQLRCSELLFKMGDDFRPTNDHPKAEQRRLAFREGYYMGSFWVFGKLAQMETRDANSRLYARAFDGGMNALDKHPADNYCDWSLRIARCILHSPSAASREIAVNSYSELDTIQGNYYFKIKHLIKNNSQKTVNILFYNISFCAPPDSLENTLSWIMVASDIERINMLPGQTKTIFSTVKYKTYGSKFDNYIPILVKFGDLNSLYYCTETGTTDLTNDQHNADLEYAFSGSSHPPDPQYILQDFLAERDLYESYIDGVGKCPTSDLNIMYYPSRFTMPFAMKTSIVHDVQKRSFALEIDAYEGNDQNIARNAAAYFQNNMASDIHNAIIERENGQPGYAFWNIFDEQKRPVGRIMLRENPAGGSFGTVITIYSAQR
jgi:hypothetical protein